MKYSFCVLYLACLPFVCLGSISLESEKANYTTNITDNNTKNPRVFVVVVQTHATQGWCRLILSAKLSNVEIITIAMGGLYSHVKRPRWAMEFLDKQNASDDDIVITVDGSDIIVSDGQKYENAVEYFIQNTAENEEKFSGEDIVKEKHISPILFMSTAECYAPQLDLILNSEHRDHMERCAWFFQAAYLAEEQLNLTHLIKWPKNQKAYLNGGGIIARVWAFRKFEKAFNEMLIMSDEWWSDQSIYKPLLLWSVYKEQNIGTRLLLPRGLIGLDYEERYFSIPVSGPIGKAAFLHLAGNAFSWRERAKEIMTNLTWYDMFISKALRSHNLGKLQTYAVSGEKLNFDYESICGNAFKEGDLFKARKL